MKQRKSSKASQLAIIIINVYQRLLAVKQMILLSAFGYHSVCKHRPTCSQYTLNEIKKNGTIAGLWRGFWRVVTCV